MESFLAGHDTMQDGMGQVFEQWNKPQSAAPATASRIMTVMFTDMVGSTDLTQAQGDAAAQNLVRRHNSIVRNALAQYSGKEIKHTGDGIMASFGSAANGVEAAIAIQRAIARNNAAAPDTTLHIRIGINSGEPIEEEEDLFGTTVQLAARVCAKCDTDDILCSNVVKELSSGRGLNFVSIGGQSLKGFKEQIMLYQVVWRE
jgi:class 3 adenylate cyclase